MGPQVKLVNQDNDNGSCHYCQRGTLSENKMGLEYPYKKLMRVEGTNTVSNFCPACFWKMIEEVKEIIKSL